MMDFSRSCIYCNTPDNLDTSMDVKVQDQKYRVSVCKAHEESADLNTIKGLVAKKLEDFKKFQEVAASMGYTITQNQPAGAGLLIPTALPPPPPAPAPVYAPVPPAQPPVDAATLPKVEVKPGIMMAVQKDHKPDGNAMRLEVLAEERRRLDQLAAMEAKSSPTYARPTTGDAARFSSHNIPEQITLKDGRVVQRPKTLLTEKQVVRGRAGTPTAVPATIDSVAGRTVINVKNTDERALEKRWKHEAEMSKGIHDGFTGSLQGSAIPREGYFENSECLMCSGSGKAKIGDGPCVRCNGTGYRGL